MADKTTALILIVDFSRVYTIFLGIKFQECMELKGIFRKLI